MSLEGNQIVLLAPGYGALLLPVRNTCACKRIYNPTMTSWLNSNISVDTCICITIQSGNLHALYIFIAKRCRKKKSHPPKTGIQRKRQWMCFTGIIQVWKRKKEKRSRTGPVLWWWDISTLAVNCVEATLFNTLNHLVTAKHSHQPDDDTVPLHFWVKQTVRVDRSPDKLCNTHIWQKTSEQDIYIYIHSIAKSIGSPPFNERFDYFSNFHEYKSKCLRTLFYSMSFWLKVCI